MPEMFVRLLPGERCPYCKTPVVEYGVGQVQCPKDKIIYKKRKEAYKRLD